MDQLERIAISKADFAALIERTPRRVDQLIKEGLPTIDNKQIPLAAGIRWLLQRKPQQSNAEELSEARRKKLDADRELVALKKAILEGQYVEVDFVAHFVGEMITNSRNMILSIPAKIAPLLVGQNEYRTVFDLLEREIHMTLTELSEQRLTHEIEAGRQQPAALLHQQPATE